jgi:hypothetical protein
VTGTFDDWAKTNLLEKKGTLHEKTVELPVATEKIYYKVGFFHCILAISPALCAPSSHRNAILPENLPHTSIATSLLLLCLTPAHRLHSKTCRAH